MLVTQTSSSADIPLSTLHTLRYMMCLSLFSPHISCAVQELRTLELYCGCGGLSFADRQTKDVTIETKWAVDCQRSMIETFKANYPYAHVSSAPPMATASCTCDIICHELFGAPSCCT